MGALEKNPYRPGASVPPAYLAGRDDAIERFRRTLRAAPEIPANVRLSGLRGVGKSVLLQRFEEQAEDDGWIAWRQELEPRYNNEADVARLVVGAADQITRRLSTLARVKARAEAVASQWSLTYDEVTLRFDPIAAAETQGLIRPLHSAISAALKSGRHGVVLLLDEAQVLHDERSRDGDHALSMLIAAVSSLQSTGAPLGLVLCGLPTLQAHLLRARTYTERMFRGEDVESLDDEIARQAFLRPLKGTGRDASPECAERVVAEVDGYPYFIQLWGAELWDAAADAELSELTVDLLDVIEPRIYERLDRDFYEGRVQTLRPAEQDILIAGAACDYPPLVVAELRKKTPKSEKNVNVLMGRLAEQGVIYRESKGVYRYSAPRFHDFLRRRVAKVIRAETSQERSRD